MALIVSPSGETYMSRKQLDELVADFNTNCGQTEKLRVQGLNGYVAVDVYRDDRRSHTLAAGTSAICGDAVMQRFIGALKDMLREATTV